jgi:DNA invertase Pin-like site-specific DNA recombinase/transcriptional regulator NrdR family protein
MVLPDPGGPTIKMLLTWRPTINYIPVQQTVFKEQEKRPEMTMKAYSYLRFSTPEQSKGDSFRRQTESARRYAELHGLELDKELTFRDTGVSAFRGLNAKVGALGAFLEAVEAGTVPKGSYLLIESLDRLSRETILEAQTVFQQIILSGITIVSLIDDKAYSRESINSNPIEVIAAILTLMRAHEESAVKARRLKAAWENKRNTAKDCILTAQAPGWLKVRTHNGKKNFVVIEDRAAVVRRIYEMTLKGMGQNIIAKTLNTERVPVFGKGRKWHRSFLVKLLASPAVVGTFIPHTIDYKDGKKKRQPQAPVKNYFPDIVDRETFERVQALKVDARSPLRGRHVNNGQLNNIFGGLAHCPVCGDSMTRVNKGKRSKPYLVCSRARDGAGCQYRSVSYDKAEKTFLEDYNRVLHRAVRGDKAAKIQTEIEQIEKGIDVTKEQIERLLDALPSKHSPTIDKKIRGLEDNLELLEKKREELYTRKEAASGLLFNKNIKALREALKRRPLDKTEVNLILRQLLSRIVIDYKSGTLVFQWKTGGETELLFAWPKEEQAV